MKIKKAIEILKNRQRLLFGHNLIDDRYAIQLAIEALKRVQQCRPNTLLNAGKPLPGEDAQ